MGCDWHELHVFPGYGHQDPFMGKNVHVDIFPRLLQHLRKHGPAVPRYSPISPMQAVAGVDGLAF